MPFKNILREFQEMKDGLGSISRRGFFDHRMPHHHHHHHQQQQQQHHRRSSSLSSSISAAAAAFMDTDPYAENGELGPLLFSPDRHQLQPEHHLHRHHHHHHLQEQQQQQQQQQQQMHQTSGWANMPPELLRDILGRVESSESTWPSRRHVVASACVCRNWREIVRELVKTPEQSGKLTFTVSLKQPGPRDTTVQCFIQRDRTNSTYYLYLGLTATLAENGKFLLAARKVRRASSADYIISLNGDFTWRGSHMYVGKLRSNFLGTKFTVFESQPLEAGSVPCAMSKVGGRRVGSKQVSPRLPAGSYNIAHISYELNVLGTKGPRRMLCTLHSIPASAVEPEGSAPTPIGFPGVIVNYSLSSSSLPSLRSKLQFSELDREEAGEDMGNAPKECPLVLKNKAPRWHEQLQCWCLNFRGRVTVASVKNFQLVGSEAESAAPSPALPAPQNDHDKVLLQFGKVGKDVFTMDYRYPLSAFQAFAICLSSFDTKLACE